LHGDLARFSYLPDLDRANYCLTDRNECSAHPVDEAAYTAAQDRYTQIRARLDEDWHACELDVDYVPVYNYLPKELPLPEWPHIRAMVGDYANVWCDREVSENQRPLRKWLPAPKTVICRALAIEYALVSERTEEDYKWYLAGAGLLGRFVDKAGPGLCDTGDPYNDRERWNAGVAQNKSEMLIGGRAMGDVCDWHEIFVLMVQAYEIRSGIRPLIEPAVELATPSVIHSGDK
jgi:hypothetical protein